MAPSSQVRQTDLRRGHVMRFQWLENRKVNSSLNCLAFAITIPLLKLLMVVEKEILKTKTHYLFYFNWKPPTLQKQVNIIHFFNQREFF